MMSIIQTVFILKVTPSDGTPVDKSCYDIEEEPRDYNPCNSFYIN